MNFNKKNLNLENKINIFLGIEAGYIFIETDNLSINKLRCVISIDLSIDTALQYHYDTASQYHYDTASRYHYDTASQYHYDTATQYHYDTATQYHYDTATQYHYDTASQYHNALLAYCRSKK